MDALRKSDETVQVPIINLAGANIYNLFCHKSGHVVSLYFEVINTQGNLSAGGRAIAILTGLPHPVSPIIYTATSIKGNVLRYLIADDYFSWHYSPAWKSSGGNECIVFVTYLTND